MGHTEKEKLFWEFVFSAPGWKLIHTVKELKDVGERNVQLEQTKQIQAQCWGTVMVKSAICSEAMNHFKHKIELRTLKVLSSQTQMPA